MSPLFLVALVPVVVHLLVRAHAPTVPFPSLRFVASSRMRAVRRRRLSDPALLLVRALILAAAAGAFAGVALPGAWGRAAADRRLVRAVVVDPRVAPAAAELARLGAADETLHLDARDLTDGLRRARARLDEAAAGRREIVVISDFALGSIEGTALDEVPAGLGLRLVRAAPRQPPAPVELGVFRAAGPDLLASPAALVVTTDGPRTRVSRRAVPAAAWRLENTPAGVRIPALAVDLLAPPEGRAALRAAAIAAVAVDLPVIASPAARPVIVALAGANLPRARTLCAPWTGRAGQALAGDPLPADGRPASVSPPAEPDRAFVTVRRDRHGAPVVRVAGIDGPPCGLLVDIRLPAGAPDVPHLLRAILAARPDVPSFAAAESLRIADEVLRRSSRPAPPAGAGDGRRPDAHPRWWWTAALCLVAVEWWMRRSRRAVAAEGAVHAPAA